MLAYVFQTVHFYCLNWLFAVLNLQKCSSELQGNDRKTGEPTANDFGDSQLLKIWFYVVLRKHRFWFLLSWNNIRYFFILTGQKRKNMGLPKTTSNRIVHIYWKKWMTILFSKYCSSCCLRGNFGQNKDKNEVPSINTVAYDFLCEGSFIVRVLYKNS